MADPAVSVAADVPRCTYRVQLRGGVGFAQARDLVPYLDRLGVSHLYLSPPFAARAGSTHGYDVVDPNLLDPGLGGGAGFEELCAALRARGMGLILDIVPNHMGVGPDNPWWWDVLEHGRGSRYAGFFDIDFDRDPGGRLVLPVLGAPLEEALAKGELSLRRDEARGGPVLAYYDTPFPLTPGSADGLGFAVADAGALRRVLDAQHYRLTFWREGAAERNYRRFFDIGELAGLRVEVPEVFEAAHALVLDLVARGLVQGLRIDHVDGLADPAGYLDRLRRRLAEARGGAGGEPFYLLVEKILVGEERLRPAWPVAGTTGYEFANQVLGVLVAPEGLGALERARAEATGEPAPFPEVVDKAKRLVVERLFPGEFAVLAGKAAERAGRPEGALKAALEELLVAFPAYRTYRRPGEPLSEADAALLGRAFGAARERCRGPARDALDRLAILLTGDLGPGDRAVVDGLQQLSGPVMAKALEDTAFYRFPRLLALSEVGGEPDAGGLTPEAFHALNAERLRAWPDTMLATATHDTKRGEDARARLAVLSEVPEEWAAAARRLRELNAPLRPAGLHPKDEYTLYQALVGVWALDLDPADGAGLAALGGRIRGYLTKALREGKERSSWLDPDAAYEAATLSFADAALDPARSAAFLEALRGFVAEVAPAGAANGLAQLLVRLTAPGVPDVYQGTELWDLSLVDPDNRRPVDWAARSALLDSREGMAADPLDGWEAGAPKLRVLAAALAFRREAPALFARGDYLPLRVEGARAAHAFAFARRLDGRLAVTLVGRHLAAALRAGGPPRPDPAWWGDTTLLLPEGAPALEDRLARGGGARPAPEGGRLPLRQALARSPVALLATPG